MKKERQMRWYFKVLHQCGLAVYWQFRASVGGSAHQAHLFSYVCLVFRRLPYLTPCYAERNRLYSSPHHPPISHCIIAKHTPHHP